MLSRRAPVLENQRRAEPGAVGDLSYAGVELGAPKWSWGYPKIGV